MAASNSTVRRFLRSSSLYFGLAALLLFGSLTTDEFLTIDNQRDVLGQVSNNGVVAVGMTLVILTGGIDLSVGSLLSVASVVCAMLLMQHHESKAVPPALVSLALTAGLLAAMLVSALARRRPQGTPGPSKKSTIWAAGAGAATAAIVGLVLAGRASHGFGVLVIILAVPAFGLMLGAINGLVIAKGNLQPFIVTLAMMVSAVGLGRYIAGKGGQVHSIYVDPSSPATTADPSFLNLALNIPVQGKELIPVPGLFFLSAALLAWILLNRTALGRYIYAVGGNEEAGRYSGLNTGLVKVIVYALSGMLSALAAVLYCAQYTQGKADAGQGRELDAIAAVVIGGTSLSGGRGGIGGTVVGVFIFGYLKNILNLRGVPTEFQQILQGLIIVLAVLLQEGVLVRWFGNLARMIKPQAPASGKDTLA